MNETAIDLLEPASCINPAILVPLHPFYIQREDKVCVTCNRTCKSCVPSPTKNCGTSAEVENRTIGTDTSDLAVQVNNETQESCVDSLNLSEMKLDEFAYISDICEGSVSCDYAVQSEIQVPETKVVSKLKKKHTCDICFKDFKSGRGLRDHAAVHTGLRNHVCDICMKSYTTKANLRTHRRTHEGRKFSCTLCSKSFFKKDSLNVHLRVHTRERPFSCNLCSRAFTRKNILQNHLETHDHSFKFVCAICGKGFITKKGLKYHENTHSTAQKPKSPSRRTKNTAESILCQLCGKTYSTLSNFKSHHDLVHRGCKPFSCHVCNRIYAKKSSLEIHLRRHNDNRLFHCSYCDYAAYRNTTLKSHLLRHTGELPFSCTKCSQRFAQTSSLAYHKKCCKQESVELNSEDEKPVIVEAGREES